MQLKIEITDRCDKRARNEERGTGVLRCSDDVKQRECGWQDTSTRCENGTAPRSLLVLVSSHDALVPVGDCTTTLAELFSVGSLASRHPIIAARGTAEH